MVGGYVVDGYVIGGQVAGGGSGGWDGDSVTTAIDTTPSSLRKQRPGSGLSAQV